MIEAALARAGDYMVEHRIIRPSGEERAVRSRGMVFKTESGEFSRMLGTVQDTTEQKATEAALRASELRYRQMFERNRAIKLLVEPGSGRMRS